MQTVIVKKNDACPLTIQQSNWWQMKNNVPEATTPVIASISHIARSQPPDLHNAKSLGDLCLEIAEFAKDRDYRTLDFLMRMAAAEAYDQTSDPLTDCPGKGELIGMWDWDVTNNKAYIDPPGAKLFGVNPKAAVTGLPLEDYIAAIHPDDVSSFSNALYQTASEGGCFKSTYRIINNERIIWVFARGSCFVGPGKTPVRFPGALFNVTASITSGEMPP